MTSSGHLSRIARSVRRDILVATSRAGSGHPTPSLSAADLMVGLLFGGLFRYDVQRPEHPHNDRLVFSKGHASPLLYALWAAYSTFTPSLNSNLDSEEPRFDQKILRLHFV